MLSPVSVVVVVLLVLTDSLLDGERAGRVVRAEWSNGDRNLADQSGGTHLTG